jgi:acetyl-CoA carboxylase biotin carboxyl carrier protein
VRGRRKNAGDRSLEQAPWSVKDLVELATRHNLAELEVESGGTRIRVVREHAVTSAGPRAQPSTALEAPRTQPAVGDNITASSLITIEAPMVGTFYRASSPSAPPFVTEGDAVSEGQVLCIIEAMKLMNEIEAKVAGRIAQVLVENGQPVEYGQPLFLVEPAVK